MDKSNNERQDDKRSLPLTIGRTGNLIRIGLPEFHAEFLRISETLFRMDRALDYTSPSVEFDVLGRQWCFALSETPPPLTGYLRDHKLHVIERPAVIFLPPLSIVKWQFMPGTVRFHSFFSTLPQVPQMPLVPTLYPIAVSHPPTQIKDIFDFFEQSKEGIPIGVCSSPSAVSRRTKEAIDKNLDNPDDLGDIAQRLKINPSLLSRYFKRDYGLLPIQYLNLLRVRDALRRIIFNGEAITSIGLGVGYGSLSQFNREFKKQTHLSPRAFRLWHERRPENY